MKNSGKRDKETGEKRGQGIIWHTKTETDVP